MELISNITQKPMVTEFQQLIEGRCMSKNCYLMLLLLLSNESLSGVMGDGKIFLSNLDSSALFCVMSAFPDGKRIEKYKINIVDEGQVLNVAIYESPQLDDSDFMGGGGVSYTYEYYKKDKLCHLTKRNWMR